MSIKGCQHNFRGTLVAFVGDTPAVNLAGGFKEGVGRAMRKCRHCMATDMQIQTKVANQCIFFCITIFIFYHYQ